MRILLAIAIVSVALGAAAQIPGPITSNPIAAPIEKRGLMVEIKDLARLPDTRRMRPADQYVRDSSGNRTNVTLQQLVEKANGAPTSRADLNISRSRDGELLISSRQDGTIRMLVPNSGITTPSSRQ